MDVWYELVLRDESVMVGGLVSGLGGVVLWVEFVLHHELVLGVRLVLRVNFLLYNTSLNSGRLIG